MTNKRSFCGKFDHDKEATSRIKPFSDPKEVFEYCAKLCEDYSKSNWSTFGKSQNISASECANLIRSASKVYGHSTPKWPH